MDNIQRGIHQTLEGFYKVSVVDADGKNIVWEDPKWKKNLILNRGMDQLGDGGASTYPHGYAYEGNMFYAIAGTGTRLNSIDSGLSTVTQSGHIITINPVGGLSNFTQSVGGYVNAAEIGDVILFAASGTANITAVSPLSCSVDTNITFADSQSFVIWKTSQTGLQNEIARAGGGTNGGYYQPSGSYWLVGYCGTNVIGNVFQLYRTYDFGIEISPKTYTEIGVGRGYQWSDVGGTTTFSRILLPDPILIGAGQRLRVSYQLNVTLQPSSSIYRSGSLTPFISGWPVAPSTNTNATESLQSTNYALGQIGSDGSPSLGYGGLSLDPCHDGYGMYVWVSPISTPLAPMGNNTAVNRDINASYVQASRNPYPGAGSYYCDKTATFGLTLGNRSDLRSMGFGYSPSAASSLDQAYAMLFDQNQTKTNTQTLTVTWRFSWSRTLSNGA